MPVYNRNLWDPHDPALLGMPDLQEIYARGRRNVSTITSNPYGRDPKGRGGQMVADPYAGRRTGNVSTVTTQGSYGRDPHGRGGQMVQDPRDVSTVTSQGIQSPSQGQTSGNVSSTGGGMQPWTFSGARPRARPGPEWETRIPMGTAASTVPETTAPVTEPNPTGEITHTQPLGGGMQATIDPNTGQTIVGHNVIPDQTLGMPETTAPPPGVQGALLVDPGAPGGQTGGTNQMTLGTQGAQLVDQGVPQGQAPPPEGQGGGAAPGADVGPPWTQSVQAPPGDQTRIEDALMNRYRRLADPYFAREQERMESNLANRGLPTTGEAYGDTTGQFIDARNRSFADASDRAIEAGMNENFRNRDLALRENLGQRGLDIQMRGQDIQESLGRAGIEMRGQEVSAQRAMAMMQARAAQGSAAAQRELGRLQMEEQRRQFDLGLQFQQGQQGWQNAYQDRGWQFNADLTGRQQFFNEMGSFFPGSPMLGMPNVPNLDATGAYSIYANTDANRFQGQYDNRQSALDYNAGLWGGATDIGTMWATGGFGG